MRSSPLAQSSRLSRATTITLSQPVTAGGTSRPLRGPDRARHDHHRGQCRGHRQPRGEPHRRSDRDRRRHPVGTTITPISGNNITLSAPVTASGTPTLAYSSSLSNTYTGATIVDQGTLNLTGIAGTTVIPGDLTINGSTTSTPTTVTMVGNAGQIASSANISINGGSLLTLRGQQHHQRQHRLHQPRQRRQPDAGDRLGNARPWAGTFPPPTTTTRRRQPSPPRRRPYLKVDAQRTTTVNGVPPVSLDITAPVQGIGGLTVTGGGGLRLSFAGNGYSGATTLSGSSTLFLGASNVIPDSSTFTMTAGTTLDLNGFNDAISQLSGAGTVTDSSTTAGTLTFGLNNANTAFSGSFNDYAPMPPASRQPERHQGRQRRLRLHRQRHLHRHADHQRRHGHLLRRANGLRHLYDQQHRSPFSTIPPPR